MSHGVAWLHCLISPAQIIALERELSGELAGMALCHGVIDAAKRWRPGASSAGVDDKR
jgi:hypothetical protein